MTDQRDGADRRRIERGGRRESDRLALTAELRAEAAGYAATIGRCLDTLNGALEDEDLVTARAASKALKEAADNLRTLLTTGSAGGGQVTGP